MQDYALSARYLADPFLTFVNPPGIDHDTYTWEMYQDQHCPPDAMRRTLQHVADGYGGVEGYLRDIGVTDAEIGVIRATMVG